MMRLAYLLLCLLTGCGYAPQVNAAREYAKNPVVVGQMRATQLGGYSIQTTCCDSMAPVIRNGDVLVFVREPFTDKLVGTITDFRTPDERVCHRLIGGDARNGFRSAGDANHWADTGFVTDKNYLGTLRLVVRQSL